MSRAVMRRLGDVAEIRAGATPRRAKAEYFGGPIAWVKIGDMESGVVRRTEETITQDAVDDHRIRVHNIGTILISIFATIGRIATLAVPAGTNQAIVAVLPKDGSLSNSYLRWMLQASVEKLQSQANGVAQANINGSVLKDTCFPLPPLDEQRRIAEILDIADGIRRRHLQARDEAKALLAALSANEFMQLNTDASVPKVRLGDIAEMYQPKTLARKELVSTGVFPVFGANGVIGQHDEFNHEKPQILISCRGTCGRVLRSAPRSWINGNAMVVNPSSRELLFDYLELVLRHNVDLESAITGVAQPQITRSSLKPLELPLPPLDEQRRIAETLDAADALTRRHQAAADEAAALLASLSHDIFTRLEQEARRESA